MHVLIASDMLISTAAAKPKDDIVERKPIASTFNLKSRKVSDDAADQATLEISPATPPVVSFRCTALSDSARLQKPPAPPPKPTRHPLGQFHADNSREITARKTVHTSTSMISDDSNLHRVVPSPKPSVRGIIVRDARVSLVHE